MDSTDNIDKARSFGRILRLPFGILVFVVIVPYYFMRQRTCFSKLSS